MTLKERYNLYKNFLKKYRPYYNVYFLADLIHSMEEEKQTFLNAIEIKEKWEKYLKKNKKENLNFYIHIPFCRLKCPYCMYYSHPVKDNGELDNYVNRLISQINFFKKIFSKVEFSSLYIGGGTPSILTKKQINKLFTHLFNSFKFRRDGEKTFECNPESIDLEKLKLLRKFGFNRISFGVQNLDQKVLFYANRSYQNYNLIRRRIKEIKSLGFEVNNDLMIGIKGDSIKSIINSFIKLIKLQPDSITLYPLKPPEGYLKKYFNNDYYSFNSSLYKKSKRIRQILKLIAKRLGYYPLERSFEIYTSAEPTFYSKNFKAPYKYSYDFTSPINYPKPCSLFALGIRASAYIFRYLQYHEVPGDQETKDFDPEEKIFWSMKFNLKEEMRYFILQQLSSRLCFSQKEFKAYFNSDFKSNFKEAISSLKKLKKIRFNKDLVFLPQKPLERYTSCLFFFDEKKVFNKIKKFLPLISRRMFNYIIK